MWKNNKTVVFVHNIGNHNELFAQSVKSVVQIYINGSFTLAGALIIIVVIYTLMNGLVFHDSNRIDFKPILRAIAITFLIVFYQDIMDVISGGIAMFTSQFSNSEGIVKKLVKLSEVRPLENSTTMEAEDLGEKIGNYLTSAFDITAMISGAFERGITLVIREIILMLRTIILGFLYLAGPIALAFSLIPKFEGLSVKWFQGWLAVQCWAITLTMLDNLVDAYQFGTDDSTLRFIANNLVVIIMYILVPYLTTYFIGGSAAGAFISKVVGSSALVLAASKTLATQKTSRSATGSNSRAAGSNHGPSPVSQTRRLISQAIYNIEIIPSKYKLLINSHASQPSKSSN